MLQQLLLLPLLQLNRRNTCGQILASVGCRTAAGADGTAKIWWITKTTAVISQQQQTSRSKLEPAGNGTA
jgi:hypothetical protein